MYKSFFMSLPDQTGRRMHRVFNLCVSLFVIKTEHDIVKMKNNFWCQLAQVAHWARAWNDQIWGQEIKGQGYKKEVEDSFGGLAEAFFLYPLRFGWLRFLMYHYFSIPRISSLITLLYWCFSRWGFWRFCTYCCALSRKYSRSPSLSISISHFSTNSCHITM